MAEEKTTAQTPEEVMADAMTRLVATYEAVNSHGGDVAAYWRDLRRKVREERENLMLVRVANERRLEKEFGEIESLLAEVRERLGDADDPEASS